MKHLDLFSGIGGFALAAQEVWGDEYECVGFVEIDKYCQALLKRRFPNVKIWGDIRTVTADAESGQPGVKAEQEGRKNIGGSCCDLITGGFPCQPFSQAGKRRGTEDNRFLWPEMLRVIKDFKPRWVLAENVRGILNIEGGMVFEQVLSDLEAIGYEVQAFIIPACAVNAPHRRDRVWIVGHTKRINAQRMWEKQDGQEQNRLCGRENKVWRKNWLEIATKLCGVDDGFPTELDGLKLSKSRHRIERLKALGNAIVPQVAVEIMRGIK